MAAAKIAPELAIDEQEAAMMAGAIQSVQNFYNFETSAEVMLWVNVIGTMGAVYGPRIMVIAGRKKTAKEKKKSSSPVMENAATPIDLAFIEGVSFPHHAPTD